MAIPNDPNVVDLSISDDRPFWIEFFKPWTYGMLLEAISSNTSKAPDVLRAWLENRFPLDPETRELPKQELRQIQRKPKDQGFEY